MMTAAVSVLVLMASVSPVAYGQSTETHAVPSLFEVYWQSSKSVVVQGITNLIVLDPEIARAETGYDTVQFFGVERGETVALGYINDKPVSIRIRVVSKPVVIPSPAMLRRQAEMAHGLFGSNVQVFNTAGNTTVSLLNNFGWSQLVGDNGRLDVTAPTADSNQHGGHPFSI